MAANATKQEKQQAETVYYRVPTLLPKLQPKEKDTLRMVLDGLLTTAEKSAPVAPTKQFDLVLFAVLMLEAKHQIKNSKQPAKVLVADLDDAAYPCVMGRQPCVLCNKAECQMCADCFTFVCRTCQASRQHLRMKLKGTVSLRYLLDRHPKILEPVAAPPEEKCTCCTHRGSNVKVYTVPKLLLDTEPPTTDKGTDVLLLIAARVVRAAHFRYSQFPCQIFFEDLSGDGAACYENGLETCIECKAVQTEACPTCYTHFCPKCRQLPSHNEAELVFEKPLKILQYRWPEMRTKILANTPVYHVPLLIPKSEGLDLAEFGRWLVTVLGMDSETKASSNNRGTEVRVKYALLYRAALYRISAKATSPPPFRIALDGLDSTVIERAQDHLCDHCRQPMPVCGKCLRRTCAVCEAKTHSDWCGVYVGAQQELSARGYSHDVPERPFVGYVAPRELASDDGKTVRKGFVAAVTTLIDNDSRAYRLFFGAGRVELLVPKQLPACHKCKTREGIQQCADCRLYKCLKCQPELKELCTAVCQIRSKAALSPIVKITQIKPLASRGVSTALRSLAYGVPRASFYRVPKLTFEGKTIPFEVVEKELCKPWRPCMHVHPLVLLYKEAIERIQYKRHAEVAAPGSLFFVFLEGTNFWICCQTWLSVIPPCRACGLATAVTGQCDHCSGVFCSECHNGDACDATLQAKQAFKGRLGKNVRHTRGRFCFNLGCTIPYDTPTKLCACLQVAYCSPECARADWKAHHYLECECHKWRV